MELSNINHRVHVPGKIKTSVCEGVANYIGPIRPTCGPFMHMNPLGHLPSKILSLEEPIASVVVSFLGYLKGS